MKSAQQSFSLHNNNYSNNYTERTSFTKGKIIVLPSSSGVAEKTPMVTAFKSKFALPSLPTIVNSNLPSAAEAAVWNSSFSNGQSALNQQQSAQLSFNESELHQHESSTSSDDEGVDCDGSERNSTTTFTTNNSLNTTFSGFYLKLIGREKRKPQCTPPIRTVVSVGFSKDYYEKQVEKQQQKPHIPSSSSSSNNSQPQLLSNPTSNHPVEGNKKTQPTTIAEQQEKPSAKPRVTWKDEPHQTTIKSSLSQQQQHQLSNQKLHQSVEADSNDSSDWMDFEIDRRPSLGPVMRSVYIKKDAGEEEIIRTRFIGEVDSGRVHDLDWKKRINEQPPPKPTRKKSNTTGSIPFNHHPSDSVPTSNSHSSLLVSHHETDAPPQKPSTQSRRLFMPSTSKPKVDKVEDQETPSEGNFISESRKTTISHILTSPPTLLLLDKTSMEKFKHIVRWIEHDLGVEFLPSTQCENDLRTGLKFAEIVARVEGEGKMKGINKLPQTTAAMHNNLERVFSVLRENKTIGLQHLWSTKETISGDYDTIWGLLEDIYNAYWKKTSKVKRNKKRVSLPIHEPISVEEVEEDENSIEEGFSIDDIIRMKRELLESSSQ